MGWVKTPPGLLCCFSWPWPPWCPPGRPPPGPRRPRRRLPFPPGPEGRFGPKVMMLSSVPPGSGMVVYAELKSLRRRRPLGHELPRICYPGCERNSRTILVRLAHGTSLRADCGTGGTVRRPVLILTVCPVERQGPWQQRSAYFGNWSQPRVRQLAPPLELVGLEPLCQSAPI